MDKIQKNKVKMLGMVNITMDGIYTISKHAWECQVCKRAFSLKWNAQFCNHKDSINELNKTYIINPIKKV